MNLRATLYHLYHESQVLKWTQFGPFVAHHEGFVCSSCAVGHTDFEAGSSHPRMIVSGAVGLGVDPMPQTLDGEQILVVKTWVVICNVLLV